MATARVPILGAMTAPDSSGNVYFQQLQNTTSNPSTNPADPLVCTFAESGTKDGLAGVFEVPENYASGAILKIVWSTNVITNNVVWDFDYGVHAGDDTESFNRVMDRTALTTGSVAAPSAAWERKASTITLTDADFTADDTVIWELFRDGVAESITGDIHLFSLLFEYTTT